MRPLTPFDWKNNCVWCGKPFTKRNKASDEHVLYRSLGGSFTSPLTHIRCNGVLGKRARPLYNNYWMNLGKSLAVNRGSKALKINRRIKFDGRLESIKITKLADGQVELEYPVTEKDLYRAAATITFLAIALVAAKWIFDPAFNQLREFIRSGKPDISEKVIHRSYLDRKWKPEHVIMVDFIKPNLVIILKLFSKVEFGTFLTVDKDWRILDIRICEDLVTGVASWSVKNKGDYIEIGPLKRIPFFGQRQNYSE